MRSLVRGLVSVMLAGFAAVLPPTPPVFARGDAAASTAKSGLAEIAAADLPREARETLKLIAQNGPFPYERDGTVFGNFEQRLPARERGYYREYTVRTPGVKHRGARRIVAGKGGERYYTEDHYQSFKRARDR